MKLAHRGEWRVAPENTLGAIRAALVMPGVDGVEFDVRSSADGEPVLLHDATLERVQGSPARAAQLTADELAAHGVPSLREALAEAGAEAFLNVELKEWVPAFVEVLESARGTRAELDRTVVTSFDDDIHRQVRQVRPTWRRWLNAVHLDREAIDRARELGCEAVSAQWRSIDSRSVAQAVAADVRVAAWTVRRRPTYRRLEGLCVVAICAEAAALDA